MDVGSWLRSLGLGQYEANFRDNKIDADVLPQLTADDLKDIGVSAVGDRRRLLAAIAALSGPTPSVNAPASPPKPAPAGGLQISAERRPITVMFCDLVGSTSLAAKLDAEDWRNLVNAYLDEASAAVTGLGGHVLKKLGDGLMALFGYPQAQENDAERAVRAALAIQRALADLNARNARSGAPELSARIGLECGSVVVDAAGEVFGEAPNVAARVQAAAEPGTVLVTASVQRQTAGLFVVEDKGAHDLKGVPAPVTLYRIVRASGGGRRGGARALTPLVGREDELALLTRRWSRALEGEGQFVQIVGEPGIGKSRLIEEFRAKLAETPHTWVEWAASQLLQNTPLHPIAEWGRLRFGGADATDEGRLADLENTLGLIGLDAAEYAPLLAPLVDIPLREDRRAKLAARGIAAPATGGDDGLGSGGRAIAAGGARLRGSALGRSDLARSHGPARRARRAVPFAGRRHHAAGIPRALGHALAPRRRFARAARPRAGAPHGRRDRQPACALRRDDRWSGRANRRRAAVRRGGDATPARARRAGRRTGDPADLAAIARRAARPARRSARSRADRRGAGARFFLPAAQRRVVIRRRIRRAAPASRARPARRKPTSCSSTAPLRPPPTVSSTR